MLLSKIDEYGKLGWLTLTLVSLWLAWPLGLMVLAFLAGSGRLQAWRSELRTPGTWFNLGPKAGPGAGPRGWAGFGPASSGNQSFDEYREETIRRLEEEQREFQDFLRQLRRARDKAEFDAFMAERRKRQADGGTGATD